MTSYHVTKFAHGAYGIFYHKPDDTYGGDDFLMYNYCASQYDEERDSYQIVLTDSIGYDIHGQYNVDLVNNFNTVTGFDYHVRQHEAIEEETIWTKIHESLIEEVEAISDHNMMIHVAAWTAAQYHDPSVSDSLETTVIDRFESIFKASSKGIVANEFKVGVKYVWNRDWGVPTFYVYIKGETHDEYYTYEAFIKEQEEHGVFNVFLIENQEEFETYVVNTHDGFTDTT